MDKAEIIIAGFGGQGVLLAGKLLCVAAMREGKHVSHIPSYGAEMRGGTAHCSVVISNEYIASPVVECPSIIITLNEPSTAKFQTKLRPGGLLIWNTSLVKTPPTRKDVEIIPIPATELSLAEGTPRGANMAAIGVLLALREGLMQLSGVESALNEVISSRNRKFNPLNRRILAAGYKLGHSLS